MATATQADKQVLAFCEFELAIVEGMLGDISKEDQRYGHDNEYRIQFKQFLDDQKVRVNQLKTELLTTFVVSKCTTDFCEIELMIINEKYPMLTGYAKVNYLAEFKNFLTNQKPRIQKLQTDVSEKSKPAMPVPSILKSVVETPLPPLDAVKASAPPLDLKTASPPLLDSVTSFVEKEMKKEGKDEYKPLNKEEIEKLRTKYIEETIKDIDAKIRNGQKKFEHNCETYNVLADRIVKHYTDLGVSAQRYNDNKGTFVKISVL